jgi:predicted DsbA family dithiol-disulfide isomerase
MGEKVFRSILFLTLTCRAAWADQACTALASAKETALVEYVRKEYKLDGTVALKLAKNEIVTGSCYRELTFEGKSSVKTWQLTLYLSPDGRFLTSELFDTTVDPIERERRKREALMAGLMQNKGSSKGADHAPVTVVEFSDFECPYCRRFADLVDQVWPEERDRVRIVFHHLPLSIHSWARAAAEGAACAQLQSSDAFWAVHDQLFRHQGEITSENVKQKLVEFAARINSLDQRAFQSCMDNELSLGLVFRDMNLAAANDVNATPTLFVNGHRISGVKDAAQLRGVIEDAAKEASSGRADRRLSSEPQTGLALR